MRQEDVQPELLEEVWPVPKDVMSDAFVPTFFKSKGTDNAWAANKNAETLSVFLDKVLLLPVRQKEHLVCALAASAALAAIPTFTREEETEK